MYESGYDCSENSLKAYELLDNAVKMGIKVNELVLTGGDL
jgi:hypothetical protein